MLSIIDASRIGISKIRSLGSVVGGNKTPLISLIFAWVIVANLAMAAGEPAEEFLNRLRAAKYFDTAQTYLDRIGQYPGVPKELVEAVDLERGQTFIDAAYSSRNSKLQDEYFQKAESSLETFLKKKNAARESEARLRLGKIQMIRGAQLRGGEPSAEKITEARQSYEKASATFAAIVESLREKLKKMRGAKVDSKSSPDQAALRDRYKAEFLEAMMLSGEALRYAAMTYDDPAKEGKQQLEQSLKSFVDLSDKYDDYVQGALALLSRGLVEETLSKSKEARDSFSRMLEAVDAPELRDAKFQATSGLIRLSMRDEPPKYQEAIDQGAAIVKDARPDERRQPSVAELKMELAKAYLAKSKDKANHKASDLKRAETEAKQLLIAASKVPGDHSSGVKETLAKLGIDKPEEEAPLPTAEDPDNFEDALQKSQQLYQASEQLTQSIAALGKQQSDEKKELESQLSETRMIAMIILRRGLSMIGPESDNNLVNQARQLLSYLLYQTGRYRESSVVGQFLAHNAPASQAGLRGGLLSLNSLQMLLREQQAVNPENSELVVGRIASLGEYLTSTWPDEPQAASAKSVLIGLALEGDRWDDARKLIGDLPKSPKKYESMRFLGQFLWADAVEKIRAGEMKQANQVMAAARDDLKVGLEGIGGGLVDAKSMKAALLLAKIHLRLGEVDQAATVLEHPKYGPLKLIEKFGKDDTAFASDLYGTELQVNVGQMTADGVDMDASLKRASTTMDKLRESVQGDDADKKLAATYLRLARSIRAQLDTALPNKKAKLTKAFRVFLERVSSTTKNDATLQWIGQTLMQLAESSMQPGEAKAVGEAAELMTTAVATFDRLPDEKRKSPVVAFQIGRSQRLLGNYGAAIKSFEALLTQKQTMIDAQIEAALVYEQWAATLPPKFAVKSYAKSISGSKPVGGKNVIWGWGKISQLTARNQSHRETFFDARYHLALCRYLWGKAGKSKELIEKSSGDVTKVAALYPELGSPKQRKKFDDLLKKIQNDLGEKPTGLKKPANTK